MSRRFVWVAAILLAAPSAGCEDAPGDRLGRSPALPTPMETPSAKRPTTTYFFARTDDRCEVYVVDGDTISTPVVATCPRDLKNGERIRLVGMTCLRESPEDASRRKPVVCPDPLTNAEKIDLFGEE